MANGYDLYYPGFTYGEDYTFDYNEEMVRDLETRLQDIYDYNYRIYPNKIEARRHIYYAIFDYVNEWCDPNWGNLERLINFNVDYDNALHHKAIEEIYAFEEALPMYFMKDVVEGITPDINMTDFDWFAWDGAAPKLEWMYESVLKNDTSPIVLCNLKHTIVYMNPAAEKNYEKKISAYVGGNLMECHNEHSREMINKVIDWFKKSADNNIVHTFYDEKKNKDVYMIALRDECKELIGYYEKHEYRNRDESPLYAID